MLQLKIAPLAEPITYGRPILLTGSCFTEHISERLQQAKFEVVSNPHGILFNPLSVASTLESYVEGKVYEPSDLFYLNELWNSWDHHTRFSDIDATVALDRINASQKNAADCIKTAGWVIITLGSAFQYYLAEHNRPVANNHRAPGQLFKKKLLSIDEIEHSLGRMLQKLFSANPDVQILFTISPVRHIRDGVVDNNRSKARLIESVHALCEQHKQAHYFPAYELLIDILRDYRYYDIDFVHPNYQATSAVWEYFIQACISPSDHKIMDEVQEIVVASRHRARFPDTMAHRAFKKNYLEKCKATMERYPFINLNEEILHFDS